MGTYRNIGLCIFFSIITCGIYMIYWFIVLTDETNAIAGEQDTSGGIAFLLTLVTCGIYGVYWAYKRGEKIDKAHMRRGEMVTNSGVLYLILYLVFQIVAYALIQNEVNKMSNYQAN